MTGGTYANTAGPESESAAHRATIDNDCSVPNPPLFDNISPDLKAHPAWLCWRLETRKGALAKVPKNPRTGENASTKNPRTWTDFETAARAYHRGGFDGVGIVLTEDLSGIDLDKCVDPETGDVEQWAQEIVNDLNSYTEMTPSGTGLHIIARGALPQGKRRRGRVEAYDRTSPRFFTVTGLHLDGTPERVEARQEALERLHARHLADPEREPEPSPPPAPPPAPTPGWMTPTDDDRLAAAFGARNGATVRALFDTPGADGNSETDAALVGHLAFYSGGDVATLERLMLRSNLVRAKWLERRGETTWLGADCAKAIRRHNGDYWEPGTRWRVARLVATVEAQEEPDVSPVFEAVPDLAALDGKALAAARRRLKETLGAALNLNDLAAAVKVERMERPPGGAIMLGGQLADLTETATRLLVEHNAPPVLFRRSGELVRVTFDEASRPAVSRVGVDILRHRLAGLAPWVRDSSTGVRAADPPETLVRNILAAWTLPFPGLEAVTETPFVRRDGTVCATPGYDAPTWLYLAPDPQLAMPTVPDNPTAEQVRAAADLVADLVADFAFADEASRAGAWALLLTPVLRPAIAGPVPLCVVDAPQARTGKSLLAEVAAIVATGRPGAMFAAPPPAR